MKRHIFARTIAAILLTGSSASAGIGIFTTPDGTNCNLTLLPGLPQNIYVLYLGEGGPMTIGAEYRIFGMPGTFGVTYTATLTPGPGSNLTLGNAFDGTGHNVAWPAVQPFDGNGNLLLATYTLVWFVTPAVPPGTILKVTNRSPCTDGACCFCCPLIVDAGFNLICQAGGEMRVNGGPPCTVAVEQRTWTGVRNLYR
jgi:hypothetical protein